MKRWLASWILKNLGWSITGHPPINIKKYVVIVVPHTSNWDFPLGLLVRYAAGFRVDFVAKKSLFRWPWGALFRYLGGHPVDRSKNNNFVDEVIKLFNKKQRLGLTIAPEGTRKKTDRLKTGFYYIAKGAHVPIILCKFDYGNKVVDFTQPFHPEEFESDMQRIERYFAGVKGKISKHSYGLN